MSIQRSWVPRRQTAFANLRVTAGATIVSLLLLRDQQRPRHACRIDAVGAREAAERFDLRNVLVLRRADDGQDAEDGAELRFLVEAHAIILGQSVNDALIGAIGDGSSEKP